MSLCLFASSSTVTLLVGFQTAYACRVIERELNTKVKTHFAPAIDHEYYKLSRNSLHHSGDFVTLFMYRLRTQVGLADAVEKVKCGLILYAMY